MLHKSDEIIFALGEIHSDVRSLKDQTKHIVTCIESLKTKTLSLKCDDHMDSLSRIMPIIKRYETESEMRRKRVNAYKWTIGTIIALLASCIPLVLKYF